MGRMIDADDLIHSIDTASDDLSERLKQVFIEIVAEIPTAYDVKKVEEQLDEYITKIVGRKSALYQTIMSIVRRGGVE